MNKILNFHYTPFLLLGLVISFKLGLLFKKKNDNDSEMRNWHSYY